jgi:hypothetical protein
MIRCGTLRSMRPDFTNRTPPRISVGSPAGADLRPRVRTRREPAEAQSCPTDPGKKPVRPRCPVAVRVLKPGRVGLGVLEKDVDSKRMTPALERMPMSRKVAGEMLPRLRQRYLGRGREGRSQLIYEVCEHRGYSRKHTIKLLRAQAGWGGDPQVRKGRPPK